MLLLKYRENGQPFFFFNVVKKKIYFEVYTRSLELISFDKKIWISLIQMVVLK